MKRHLLYSFLMFSIALVALASCNVADDGGPSVLGSECPTGQSLCDSACYDLNTSSEACGTCGNTCSAGEICAEGSCQTTCPAGYVACDGACVNPQDNPDWCGATDACDPADASLKCTDGEVCSDGSCELVCADGTIECDGRCVDPNVDRQFCGAQGNCTGGNIGETCLGNEVCDRGSCADTCPEGSVGCDGGCIDPNTNPRFCNASGSCSGAEAGTMCESGNVCQDATCVLTCAEDRLVCDGACIDPMTDPNYCGAVETCGEGQAGEVCGFGESCLGGTCFSTDYTFFSPFDTTGTLTYPRDTAYRVDTLIDGVTMHYTIDNTPPVPGEGTTTSTGEFIDTGRLATNSFLRVVFERNEVLSGQFVIRHLTDPAVQTDVNNPDNVSINGAGIIETVAPGAEINLTLDVILWKLLAETTGQAVYFAEGVGVIHCESLTATPPGVEKSLDLTFNAPAERGTYQIYSGISYENDCAAVTDRPDNAAPHAVIKVR